MVRSPCWHCIMIEECVCPRLFTGLVQLGAADSIN